uniref:Protein AAR2 homolog n=1 Tax=Leptobrachium leishanense TaxID=445787 RepID=A0A8C5R8B1_9ANUR
MCLSNMDPELARHLFFEGATLVLLGVPEGTEFGIDCNSWEAGPRFRGVKMVPPGVHFIHYSAEKLRLQLTSLDPFLGPYPFDSLRHWVSLSSHIKKEVTARLQPVCGNIYAFPEVLPTEEMTHTEDRARHNLPRYDLECQSYKEGMARLPLMKQKAGTEIRFSQLPDKMYPENASPAEVTLHSMDLSYALGRLLETYYPEQPTELLAELQFSFVCFVLGNVYEGFEQWKNLLNLLCRAETFALQHPDMYSEVISILYHQLAQVPTDFFIDIVSQDNFLTSTLQVLFSFLCSPSTDKTLRKKAVRFRAHLTKKFQWDFEEDPLDCAPIVVQLPEGWDATETETS